MDSDCRPVPAFIVISLIMMCVYSSLYLYKNGTNISYTTMMSEICIAFCSILISLIALRLVCANIHEVVAFILLLFICAGFGGTLVYMYNNF
jgi:hypothetical protein